MNALLVVVAVGAVVVAVIALAVARSQRDRARAEGTARHAAIEELGERLEVAQSERRSSMTVLSSMEEGVLLFGPDGRTRLANAAAELHLGARP